MPYEYVKRKLKKPRKYWVCSRCKKRQKNRNDGAMEIIEVETLCEDCIKKKIKGR